jgi:hypothetical protein
MGTCSPHWLLPCRALLPQAVQQAALAAGPPEQGDQGAVVAAQAAAATMDFLTSVSNMLAGAKAEVRVA